MIKSSKLIFSFFLLVLSTVLLMACSSNNSYTVTFDANGGTPTPAAQVVLANELATEPDDPTRDGYIFAGWFLGDEAFIFSTPITADITLVAKWDTVVIPSFTVTFNSNGGSAVASQTILQGQLATKPSDPTKEGYVFVGWFINDSSFNFNTPISGNITLVASWDEVVVPTFVVTFNPNGGFDINTQTVLQGQLATRPDNPIKAGFTFIGWLLADELFDFDTPITADITLIAAWEEIVIPSFTVTFDSNGGSTVASQTIVENELATMPDDPNRDGFTFVGWLLAGEPFDFETPITANITLVADWEEIIIPSSTVTFDSNGGSTVASQAIVENELATMPDDPTRDGFTFIGWLLASEPFDFDTPITADITLIAAWEEIVIPSFTVTFDSNGGSTVASQTISENELATMPDDPTRDGFIFIGWLLAGEPFDFDTPITANITLIAAWDEIIIPSFTVTFDSNGGSSVASQTIVENKLATMPDDPTKEGFIFIGWLLAGEPFDFETPITANITLVAAWEDDLSEQLNAALNISLGFGGTVEEAQVAFEANASAFGIDLTIYNLLSSEDQLSGIILLQQQLTPYLPYVDQYIEEANRVELEAFALFITNTITVWHNLETARRTSELLLDENGLLNLDVTQDDITQAWEQLELATNFTGTSWHELFLMELITTLSEPIAQTITNASEQLNSLTVIRLAATNIADAILTDDPEIVVSIILNDGTAFGLDLTNFLLLSYENQVRAATILLTNLAPYNAYLYDYIAQTNSLAEISEFAQFIDEAVVWYLNVLALEDVLETLFDVDTTLYPSIGDEQIDEAILLADQILAYQGLSWHQKQLQIFLASLVTPYKTQLLNAKSFLSEKEETLQFNSFIIANSNLDVASELITFSTNNDLSLITYNQLSSQEQLEVIDLLIALTTSNYIQITSIINAATTSGELQEYKNFIELLFEKYKAETTILLSLESLVAEGALATHKDQHDINQLNDEVTLLTNFDLASAFNQILLDGYLLASATNINSEISAALALADNKTIYVSDEASLRSANSQTNKIIILTDNIDLNTKFEVNTKNIISAQFDVTNNRYYAITFLHNSTANAYGNNNTIMLSKNDVSLKRLTIISYVLYNANIIQWYGTTNGYLEDVTIINQTTSNSNAGIQITSKSAPGGVIVFAEVTINRLHTVNTRWAGVVADHNAILNVIGLGSHQFLTTVNSSEYDRVDFRTNAGFIDSSYPNGSQKGVINIIGDLGYIQNQYSGGVAYFSVATLNYAAQHIISNSILNIVKNYLDIITVDLIFTASFSTSNSIYIDRPIRIYNSSLAPNVSFIIGNDAVYLDDETTPLPFTTELTATTLTQLKEYVGYDFVTTINYTASQQSNAGYFEITRETPLVINLTNPQPFLFNSSSAVSIYHNEVLVLNATVLSITTSTNIALLINNDSLAQLTSSSSVATPETQLTRSSDLLLVVVNENVVNGRLYFFEGAIKHTLVINSTESNLNDFVAKYFELFGAQLSISFSNPLY